MRMFLKSFSKQLTIAPLGKLHMLSLK